MITALVEIFSGFAEAADRGRSPICCRVPKSCREGCALSLPYTESANSADLELRRLDYSYFCRPPE
ncbi:hypothetical protein J2W92_002129 [Rhizobium leguminosarum]